MRKENSANVKRQSYLVSKKLRNEQNGHASFVIWFTGLSGSGKSTLANGLEQMLYQKAIKSYVLDGDNIRTGICNDLDFTDDGRKENIRRVAEIAKLMVDAGLIVLTSFISPFRSDRRLAKKIIGTANFIEVYVNCPLEVCEERDTKGLYAKARSGKIKHFTGIDSPYEKPVKPSIIVNTDTTSLDVCLKDIYKAIEKKIKA